MAFSLSLESIDHLKAPPHSFIRSLLALHLRLQPIHLHLHALAFRLRLLDLGLQALDFALDEVEARFDGHDGFGALLFEEDGPDELVDGGGGGEGGEFLRGGVGGLVCGFWLGWVWVWQVRDWGGRWGWGMREKGKEREKDLLYAFVFLLLRFEALAGGDGGLEVWGLERVSVDGFAWRGFGDDVHLFGAFGRRLRALGASFVLRPSPAAYFEQWT